jgi:hypothetical protein
VTALDELEKLPTIKDLANAVAKVFAVEEGKQVGHLMILDGKKLEDVSVYADRSLAERAEYALAAGDNSDTAMKNSDFMSRAGYVAVVIKEGQEEAFKAALGDTKIAVYESKDGRVLMLPIAKAAEVENAGLAEIATSDINRTFIEQKIGKLKPELVQAGKEFMEKVIDGITFAVDSPVAVKALLARFSSLEEMVSYMGIEGEVTEAGVGKAFIEKLGEILKYEKEGAIDEQGRNLQIDLLRTLESIVLASINEGEKIKDMIEKGDDTGLHKMTERNKLVNRYVITKAMLDNLKVTQDSIVVAQEEINVEKLKAAVETKQQPSSILDKIKNIDLGAVIAEGRRGKKNYPIMISDMRTARAVAVSA